jgi:thymidylate synthase (FAD)
MALPNPDSILMFLEVCGRVAYKSEERISPGSATKFVSNIVSNHHLSVIEHVGMTVRFIVDRGVSHELVRHRLCSFTQESTRYCNYGKGGGVTFIIPPWVEIEPGEYDEHTPIHDLYNWFPWYQTLLRCERGYLTLLDNGWTPQQARSVLPNSLKTELIITANLREWRHIFEMRCAKGVHPQMAETMIPLRDELKKLLPQIFED